MNNSPATTASVAPFSVFGINTITLGTTDLTPVTGVLFVPYYLKLVVFNKIIVTNI